MRQSYEKQMNRERRKLLGAFYTPAAVIEFIIDHMIAEEELINNPFITFLDPACGSGFFLLHAYDRLHAMFSRLLPKLRKAYGDQLYMAPAGASIAQIPGGQYWTSQYLPYHIISHCLFGVDLDAEAVKLAATALAARSGLAPETANLHVGDSLDDSRQWRQNEGRLRREWPQSFDCVFGNPPYISFGIRGTPIINQERYLQLRDKYPNSAEYKLSMYALFFEQGIRLLKCGGRLGFITPDSFLAGRYYGKLRKLLLSYAIEGITLLDFKVFSDASIGKGVITLLTKAPNDSQQVQVAIASDEHQLADRCFSQQFRYEQRYMGPNFSLFLCSEELEVFQAMQALPERLHEHCSMYSGCIARYGQNSIMADAPVSRHVIYDYQGNIVLNDPCAAARWRRLVPRGGCVRQYTIECPDRYVYVHEDEAIRRRYAKSGFDLTKYAQEKLFLRQTGADLVAAYDNKGYFCLNNLHVVASNSGRLPLKLLLALLNSRLYQYYYRCITREDGRVLPQVDLDILRQLPVVPVVRPHCVIELVNELLGCYGQTGQEQKDSLPEIRQEIERLIVDSIDVRQQTKDKILKYHYSRRD